MLAYDDAGSVLLCPANQTTQTVNEVDGSANAITLTTPGYTINIRGVNDQTGELLSDSDLFPVIKAKDGSTWAANTILFCMLAGSPGSVGSATCKLDKIIFDGNNLAPRVVHLGDNTNDVVYCYWGTVYIRNSQLSLNGYNLYLAGYIAYGNAYAHRLYISGGGVGLSSTRPIMRVYELLHIDGCMYGMYMNSGDMTTPYSTTCNRMIISHCAVGIRNNNYDFTFFHDITFVNNVIDLQMLRYSATLYTKRFVNCLFFNDNPSGNIVQVDNSTYVAVIFENCVLGTANGAVIDSGVTSTRINCRYITSDPFMDKANGDYRLNPDSPAFDTVYNRETGEFYGALGPAIPEAEAAIDLH